VLNPKVELLSRSPTIKFGIYKEKVKSKIVIFGLVLNRNLVHSPALRFLYLTLAATKNKMINQIESITSKLAKVRELDLKFQEFGANEHKYYVNPGDSSSAIINFEKEHNVTLPEDYKLFLLKLGNGGKVYKNLEFPKNAAGPGYGIYPLGVGLDEICPTAAQSLSKKVFFDSEMSKNVWESKALKSYDSQPFEIRDKRYNEMYSGIMIIGHNGCSSYNGIILNGKDAGKIVYLTYEMEYMPQLAKEANFLDWYENWLDGIINERLATANTFYSSLWQKFKTQLSF
jgi:hypothetical protein